MTAFVAAAMASAVPLNPSWLVVSEQPENPFAGVWPVVLHDAWPLFLIGAGLLVVLLAIREFFLRPLGAFRFASVIAETKATFTDDGQGGLGRARPERFARYPHPPGSALADPVPPSRGDSPRPPARPVIDDDNLYRILALQLAMELEAAKNPEEPRVVDLAEIDAKAAVLKAQLEADPIASTSGGAH